MNIHVLQIVLGTKAMIILHWSLFIYYFHLPLIWSIVPIELLRMIPIGLCLVSVFIVLITYWIHRWKNPICKGTLPPGSLGFPIIGESIQLLVSSSNSLDLHPFFKRRIQRSVPWLELIIYHSITSWFD